jgi:cytochrome c-type biogenesis protein CcmH/NrfG
MNPDQPPIPDPNPQRLSLDALADQLRALPPPAVPDHLAAKLIAAIPPAAATTLAGVSLAKRWPSILAITAAGIVAIGLVYTFLHAGGSKTPLKPDAERGAAEHSAPATSKALAEYEEQLRVDPYNAEAWFNLAKAQAELHRSADAISSARKAIDIGRSRDRADFVQTVETWLRSYRATLPKDGQPSANP